jgi:hypothetical protein
MCLLNPLYILYTKNNVYNFNWYINIYISFQQQFKNRTETIYKWNVEFVIQIMIFLKQIVIICFALNV